MMNIQVNRKWTYPVRESSDGMTIERRLNYGTAWVSCIRWFLNCPVRDSLGMQQSTPYSVVRSLLCLLVRIWQPLLVFSGYIVDVGFFLLFWLDFQPDQETRSSHLCRVLGEPRGGAAGFSKEA